VGDSRGLCLRWRRADRNHRGSDLGDEVGRRLGIDEVSLRSHPMRHVLTMAIGVSPELRRPFLYAAAKVRCPDFAVAVTAA